MTRIQKSYRLKAATVAKLDFLRQGGSATAAIEWLVDEMYAAIYAGESRTTALGSHPEEPQPVIPPGPATVTVEGPSVIVEPHDIHPDDFNGHAAVRYVPVDETPLAEAIRARAAELDLPPASALRVARRELTK